MFLSALAPESEHLLRQRLAAPLTPKLTLEREGETLAERLAWVTRHANDISLLLDQAGRIVGANDRALAAYGYTLDELRRLSPGALRPAAAKESLSEQLDRFASPDGVVFETLQQRKDGSIFPVEVSARPAEIEGRQFHLGMFRDITERKRAEAALQSGEKRFKALFEHAAVGVALAEVGTSRFAQVNRRFCEMVGRSREEMEQLAFAAITHPQDLEFDLETARLLTSGAIRERTREKRYLRKDGSEVWVNLTVSAMWEPGEIPDYFIVVVHDIGERKKLEEQFRQAQKMEVVGTLAGGIAHDFNNILGSISGYTELAEMILKENPEVREYLGTVLQAASRATDLVRQILTFSRQQPLERRSMQLVPVVAETLKLLRATIPSTVEFDRLLAADAPTVFADASQIHQILMNLATNACHAMENGPGRLQVKLERCVVDEAHASAQTRMRPGAYARLSVSDTGCGMAPEIVQRIFEPFFTTKPPGEGTGLGLAVVQNIMDNHDGAITVHSRPGEGTVFHLYFPEYTGEPAAAVVEEGPVPRGHGERVLFVEDEELLAELGKKILAALGYEVEVAKQPAAAIAKVSANPHRFALVITDQTMPGMTGLVLASRLRHIRPGLPVILMSGYNLSLTSERLAGAGIRQLLLKPTTIHALGTAVHAALSARPAP